MEVNLLPPTCMEISLEVNLLSLTSNELTSMEVGGNFHGSRPTELGGRLWKSCGSNEKFVVLLEVGGSMWGCMVKLVEAPTEYTRGSWY